MRLFLLFILTFTLLYPQKIALLIGNSDYSFAPLDNPLHDVDGLYDTLREIGFKKSNIKILKNSSQNEMKKALFDFEQKASSSDIALIYFSGHGMQVNNTNYMFPANTTATKPIHLEGLVNLNFFIQSATSAKYGIVLVDACRNNPLIKYFQNGKHKGSNAKKGLGQVTPTIGQVVIGFATSAGDTADDGTEGMSPYATSLTKWLKKPDDIRNILGKVAIEVSSKYEQNPIYRANLAESVYLGEESHNRVIDTYIATSIPKAKSKWIDPSERICKSKGGEMYKGVCRARWRTAKRICSAIGGTLPTIKELRLEVSRCDGEPTTYNYVNWEKTTKQNRGNQKYQSCYQENGFSNQWWYSSSTEKNHSSAWLIHFERGRDYWDKKSNHYYVRCIQE